MPSLQFIERGRNCFPNTALASSGTRVVPTARRHSPPGISWRRHGRWLHKRMITLTTKVGPPRIPMTQLLHRHRTPTWTTRMTTEVGPPRIPTTQSTCTHCSPPQTTFEHSPRVPTTQPSRSSNGGPGSSLSRFCCAWLGDRASALALLLSTVDLADMRSQHQTRTNSPAYMPTATQANQYPGPAPGSFLLRRERAHAQPSRALTTARAGL